MVSKGRAGVTIRRRELHDELGNLAYVVGDVAEGSRSAHALHQTFDICEDGNRERIDSLLDLSFMELRGSVGSDHRQFRRVRAGYRVSGEEAELTAAIGREYLVCRTLGRWLEITLPEAAPVWLSEAERMLVSLRCRRGGVRRRRLSPF